MLVGQRTQTPAFGRWNFRDFDRLESLRAKQMLQRKAQPDCRRASVGERVEDDAVIRH
jgi:hypothetical protein